MATDWALRKARALWDADDGVCNCERETPLVGACAGCLTREIAAALDAAREYGARCERERFALAAEIRALTDEDEA